MVRQYANLFYGGLLSQIFLCLFSLQLNYLYKCRYKCRVSTSSGKIREYIFFEGEGL